MFRRSERHGRHSHSLPGSRSATLTWCGMSAAILLVSLVTGPSGSTVPDAARAVATTVVHPPVQIENSSNGLVSSTNWAGYAVTYAAAGTLFSNVSGSWVQPAAICPTSAQEDAAFWLGIDGFQRSSNTVEQIGTDSDCDKRKKHGDPTYYAWWELYPQASVTITRASHPVSAGDTMTASVSRTGSAFTLTLNDVTRGWKFTTPSETPTTAAQDSSAEWIAEAPSICKGALCNTSKLADFSIISFTGATADGNPINSSLFNDNEIDMMKGKKTVKAATSNLTGGTSFNVTWHHT